MNVQESNEQSTQSDNVLDTIHIAQPTYTIGERRRVPNIPYSVIKWRQEEELERMQEFQNMTEEERHQYEEDRLKNDDIADLERKIKNNGVKKLMKTNGGEGIFFIPDRANFILENPDWKNDIIHEFMNEKEVSDYVDPDILEKLQKLY